MTATTHDTLAARPRVTRQAAGMTQVELAMRAGSEQTFILRIERDESMGTPELLRAIGKELKVTVSYPLGEVTADHAVQTLREAIASDRKMPKGLHDLAGDNSLIKAMKVAARDLKTLASGDGRPRRPFSRSGPRPEFR